MNFKCYVNNTLLIFNYTVEVVMKNRYFMNDCAGISSYELTKIIANMNICSKTLRFDNGRQLVRFSIVVEFITIIIIRSD